jgi:hypothetical protein
VLCAVLVACAHPGTRAGHLASTAAAEQLAADGLLARGIASLHAGDGLRAEQYLVLAVRAGAPASRVIVPLVQACVSSSRLQSALDHALPHLRRHPDAWRLRLVVAAIQLALGRSHVAQDEIERVLRVEPRAARAHYLSAVIARDVRGDERAASAGFAAYVRAEPDGEHAAEARAFLREQPAAESAATGGADP